MQWSVWKYSQPFLSAQKSLWYYGKFSNMMQNNLLQQWRAEALEAYTSYNFNLAPIIL